MTYHRLIMACAGVSVVASLGLAVVNLSSEEPVAEATPVPSAPVVVEVPPEPTDFPPPVIPEPPAPEPPVAEVPIEEPTPVFVSAAAALPTNPAGPPTAGCDGPGNSGGGNHTGWTAQGRECAGKP